MYTSVLQNNPPWTHSPLLRHSLAKSSALSWRVKHFNIIWRKLDQISQRSWLYKRRMCDQILFKIHWLYSLCQRNLQGEIQRGTERECENCCRYLQRKTVSWWRDNGKYSLKCRSLRFKIEKYILLWNQALSLGTCNTTPCSGPCSVQTWLLQCSLGRSSSQFHQTSTINPKRCCKINF